MAFVTDTFTEPGDVNLSSHIGEVGATWTHHPDASYSAANITVDAATDRVWGGGTSAYYASGVPASADYYVQADFYHASTIAVNIAICARMDTTADTMYLARLTDGTTWTMRKAVAGTFTTLGTSTNQIPAVGASKVGKLVVNGDQVSFYVEGVLEIGPITDTAITAAGRAGIRSANTSSATTGMHIDNFSAAERAATLGVFDPELRIEAWF